MHRNAEKLTTLRHHKIDRRHLEARRAAVATVLKKRALHHLQIRPQGVDVAAIAIGDVEDHRALAGGDGERQGQEEGRGEERVGAGYHVAYLLILRSLTPQGEPPPLQWGQ